jgi:hypothetical protein
LGGLSKALALAKEKSSFGRVDVDFTEEVSCAPVLVTAIIMASNIAMAKLVNNLNFKIFSPYFNYYISAAQGLFQSSGG